MKLLRSIVSCIARRMSGSLNGGVSRLTSRLIATGVGVSLADRLRRLALDVAHRLDRDLVGEGHVELAGDKGERLGRAVRDDRPFDSRRDRAGPASSNPGSSHPDVFVRLELDEFERAGADRMGAHVARRHMARIDRRHAGRQQHQKRRLRALQHKGHA